VGAAGQGNRRVTILFGQMINATVSAPACDLHAFRLQQNPHIAKCAMCGAPGTRLFAEEGCPPGAEARTHCKRLSRP
jgi:hypothetical protein